MPSWQFYRDAQRLTKASALQAVRQRLAKDIQASGIALHLAALLQALCLGMREGITFADKQLFWSTGTSHLLAISGLHVGLVVGMTMAVMLRLSRLLPITWAYVTAGQSAAVVAFMVAIAYSGLAGFSLPTVRAVLMTSVMMLGLFNRRHLGLWQAFSLALILMLSWQPKITDKAGFWLSFSAVAWLLYSQQRVVVGQSRWTQVWQLQWMLTLGMLPLNLWIFHRQAVYSLLANLVAIPSVGLVIVPLSLCTVVIDLVNTSWAHPLWQIVARLLAVLLQFLQMLQHWPWAVLHHRPSCLWTVLMASLGMVVLLAPKGMPCRWLGVLMLLPMFFYRG